MTRQRTYLIASFFKHDEKSRPEHRFLRNAARRGAVRRKRRNEWEDSVDGFGAHQFDDVDGGVERILGLLKRLKLVRELTERRGFKIIIYRVTVTNLPTGYSQREKRKVWPVSPLEALAQVAE